MAETTPARFQDPDYPIEQRVEDLIGRMDLAEKVSQMMNEAAAIPRLRIPEYNWWNECLHGVAYAGAATVFPQAIGMAASFNPKLVHCVATAIADEARAKHHLAAAKGNRGKHVGLTFFAPNVNIFRDPRWGRGQETYGEDPYLTARLGVAFVQGLQGDDEKYLKVVATPKHYAVHSGPEADRHHFDAAVSRRDLHETYLPAFKACVQEGKAGSIMSAYNRTNGEACCASNMLLHDVLRSQWGFDGFVVSDCGAVQDMHQHHKITRSAAESAALAVKNGCDLNCGCIYAELLAAVDQGLVTETAIDTALRRLLTTRFRLGMFDPPETVRFAQVPPQVVECQQHRELALQMARQSIVLLKNEAGLLPLDRAAIRIIAVVGPNCVSIRPLLGNYHGHSSRMVTPLEGIVGAAGPGTKVVWAEGCQLCSNRPIDTSQVDWAMDQADVVIAVMGLTAALEGEEKADAAGGGDRLSIGLPGRQDELLEYVARKGKPLVLVLACGSPVTLGWAEEHVPAIVSIWYPGQEGGQAIADVLFGDYNPAGRLPVTFVKSLDQVPPFDDYAMKGRSYRFMTTEPLYRFGYGLSYTSFRYANLCLSRDEIRADESLGIAVDVENTGRRAGDEVVQLYVSDVEASVPVPIRHLEGFERVHLTPGEKKRVTFTLRPQQLAAYDEAGKPFVEPGTFVIAVGGGQPHDPSATTLTATLNII